MRLIPVVLLALLTASCAPTVEADRSGKTPAELRSEADGGPLTPGGVLTEILEGRLIFESDDAAVIFTDLTANEVQGRLGPKQDMFPASASLNVKVDTGASQVYYRVRDGAVAFWRKSVPTRASDSGASTVTCTSTTRADGSRTRCTSGGRIVYESSCTVSRDGTITCRSSF